MTDLKWPTNAAAWRDAFERGIGLHPAAGSVRQARGDLDPAEFVTWIESEFSESRGYHADFVPSLTRNIRGLLAWAYGDGPEPYWPGSDHPGNSIGVDAAP